MPCPKKVYERNVVFDNIQLQWRITLNLKYCHYLQGCHCLFSFLTTINVLALIVPKIEWKYKACQNIFLFDFSFYQLYQKKVGTVISLWNLRCRCCFQPKSCRKAERKIASNYTTTKRPRMTEKHQKRKYFFREYFK